MTLGFPSPGSARASALAYRDFRLFQVARCVGTVGLQMQGVAIGWQVYAVTGNPLDLGYVGLAQFLPGVGLSLLAGHVADRFDRRRILVICYAVLMLAGLSLWGLTAHGHPSIRAVYAILAVVGAARAFSGPAGSALMPNLVPAEHFSSAVAWNSSIWHVAVVAGPPLGGLLYSGVGASTLYLTVVILELVTTLLLLQLAPRARTTKHAERTLAEVLAGVRYVWRNRVILGAISLDLFAVLLGGAVALLPVYARDILRVGPSGLGLLRSAPALGAIAIGILLAHYPLRRHAGAVMLGCVGLFGLATIVFGVSRSFVLSLSALAVAGAADMVSVYVRHTLVQLKTPDAMRGRVSAVNSLFIGTSNELGEFESGITAAWLGTVPAVVLGGVGTCCVVLVWTALFPSLRKIQRLDKTDVEPS